MRKHIQSRLADARGSSMISVLMAFVILLLGIGAFSAAVLTANDMVRRANMINTATGEVLEAFYASYVKDPNDKSNFVTTVYDMKEDGTSKGTEAFKLHTKMRNRTYEVKVENPSGGGGSGSPKTMKYEFHYFKQFYQ